MGNEGFGFLDRFGMSRTLARWARALQMPGLLPARDLATLHADMVTTRDRIGALASRAQIELQLRGNADEGIDRPEQCDWAARAAPWRQKLAPRGQLRPASPHPVGSGMTLFHDAANPDLLLRQDPAPPDLRGPLFALVFEVYRFDGSFISLVQDLPESAVQGLTRHHVLSVDLRMTREHPIEVYARLNVQHGPNQEQIVRQVAFHDDRGRAEFDLAYTKINEKRIEKAWLDLILESPEMNRIAILDMVVVRAPRADI